MREKLIKLLYQAPCESDLEGRPGSCPYRKYGRCVEVDRLDYCTVQRLADHLIANGVVVSKMETTTKWIPVTERLPDNLDAYLVVVMYKYNHELEYSYDTDVATFDPSGDAGYIDGVWSTYNDWDEGQDCLTVTHWMPLPEPPKGE